MVGTKVAAVASLLAGAAVAVPQAVSVDAKKSPFTNAASSLRILYQNNLNMTDDVNHMSAILLDPMTQPAATAACQALGENLLSKQVLMQYKADFLPQLSYIEYAGYTPSSASQVFWLADNVVVQATQGGSSFTFPSAQPYIQNSDALPVLCTNLQGQAVGGNTFGYGTNPPSGTNVTVQAASSNQYTGFRNQKAFRFNGIRYAENPGRFNYSSVTTAKNQAFTAFEFGPQCMQLYSSSGSEDCFFLNIQTPVLPAKGSKTNLRPVEFWIYGGGFTGGNSAGYNGDQLASREDVVVVSVNYRLAIYGFLAVPGTNATGNYGIGDQITGLDWVIKNIQYFGGDPNQITIAGQSAGAGSVRALLGSPKAIGKFQGALAESNLGGGVALGLSGTYSTTYSSYLTITGSFYQSGGNALFTQAGCGNVTGQAGVDCLINYSGALNTLPNQPRYVVQDGAIVNTPELEVATKNNQVAHVPVIFGNAANDGASIGSSYSKTCANETACLVADLGISEYWAENIIASGLFPSPNTGNVTADAFNVSQRVSTDLGFLCVDQATVYAGTISGAFPAAWYYSSQVGYFEDAYNPNGVNIQGTIEPGYPLGNPATPYYVVHSADLGSFFGTVSNLRGPSDLYAIQNTLDLWGSFVRTGNPNPSVPMLKLRQYTKTVQAINQNGPWNQVSSSTGPIALFEYPVQQSSFIDLPQCSYLNYSITYYLSGGS